MAQETEGNIINVGPKGTFRPSGQWQTTPGGIEALFKRLEREQPRQLALYFHGGLVSEADGIQTARSLQPVFEQADCTPIFFVWETGLLEIIPQNLSRLLSNDLVKRLLQHTLKAVAKRWGFDLGEKAIGQELSSGELGDELEKAIPFENFTATAEPLLDEQQVAQAEPAIQEELEQDLLNDQDLFDLAENAQQEALLQESQIKGLLDDTQSKAGPELALAAAGFALKVALRALNRRAKKLDHGLHATLVEETLRGIGLDQLGKATWDGMKEAARQMWRKNSGEITESSRVGDFFLTKLAAYLAAHPDTQISLIGHSAGSIVTCHLLGAIRQHYPGVKINNILLLAPACSSDLFYEHILLHPEGYQQLRMFTMSDEYEREDVLVPGLYPYSLLYLVSGVLEDAAAQPLVGLHRCLSGTAPYSSERLAALARFFAVPGQLVLSKTPDDAEPGMQSTAIKHGDFDNDPATLSSLQTILAGKRLPDLAPAAPTTNQPKHEEQETMIKQFEHGYALLIGVDENAVPAWALPDVAKDIRALAAVLTHPERCAYPAENIQVISGKQATKSNIEAGLQWLAERLAADPNANQTALIYYSGHGWQDNSLGQPAYYLIPYDVVPKKLRQSALRADDFAAEIAGLAPRRLLVLMDCCHAGGMDVKDLDSANLNSFALPPGWLMSGQKAIEMGAKDLEAGLLQQGQGRAVVNSSRSDEKSYIRKDRAMSIFTYHIIGALTGHAPHGAEDKQITAADLLSHVWRKVPLSAQADYGKPQHPDGQISGNFPIALLLGGEGAAPGKALPDPLADAAAAAQSRPAIDQRGQTVYGSQTNIAGNVSGPVLSGNFKGPVQVGSGSQINLGNITASGGSTVNFAGRDVVHTVTRSGGADAIAIAKAFATVLQAIDRLNDDEQKSDAKDAVEKLRKEAEKGEIPNESRARQWFNTLAGISGDVFEVAVATFTNPASGLSMAFRKIAAQAKAERSARR